MKRESNQILRIKSCLENRFIVCVSGRSDSALGGIYVFEEKERKGKTGGNMNERTREVLRGEGRDVLLD